VSGLFHANAIDNITFINPARFFVTNGMTGAVGVLKFNPVFLLTDCNRSKLSGSLYGDSYDLLSPHGPVLFLVENDLIDTVGLEFDVKAENAVSALMIEQKSGSSKRLKGVRGVTNLKVGTYGYRAFQSGDDCNVEINAEGHARSFYPVGVSNQHATVNSRGQVRTNDVLIKTYTDHVKNITVDINQTESVSDEWPVVLEQQNDSQGGVSSIKNVTVNLRTDALRSSPNAEFFKIAQRNNNQTIADFTTNDFDEIEFNLLGNQASSANPKIALLTAVTNKGTIKTDFISEVVDTKGFTFLKGNAVTVKRRGAFASSSRKLYMQQVNRSNVKGKLTVAVTGDYSSGVSENRLYAEYYVAAILDDIGGGTVLDFSSIYTKSNGTAPSISITFSAFNLNVLTSGDSLYQGANAEIFCKFEFMSHL
jgi:hypothetical protein